jgi:hypothetical protein
MRTEAGGLRLEDRKMGEGERGIVIFSSVNTGEVERGESLKRGVAGRGVVQNEEGTFKERKKDAVKGRENAVGRKEGTRKERRTKVRKLKTLEWPAGTGTTYQRVVRHARLPIHD